MLAEVAGSIEFNIYGPQEDASYWEQCLQRIRLLPANIKVGIHPEVQPAEVREAFASHHVFLFPTLGENFGHVIYEALSAGIPVILSDQTPWRGLQPEGAGWDLPLDRQDLFRAAIQECVDMDAGQFRAAAESAKTVARRFAGDNSVIAANRALFFGDPTDSAMSSTR